MKKIKKALELNKKTIQILNSHQLNEVNGAGAITDAYKGIQTNGLDRCLPPSGDGMVK